MPHNVAAFARESSSTHEQAKFGEIIEAMGCKHLRESENCQAVS